MSEVWGTVAITSEGRPLTVWVGAKPTEAEASRDAASLNEVHRGVAGAESAPLTYHAVQVVIL